MPVKLSVAAQMAMDLYYQDYAPSDNRFFELSDFMFHIATVYSEMLDETMQIMRKEMKAQEGFANIDITNAWMIREQSIIEFDEEQDKYSSTTKQPIFGFSWDGFNYALQSIEGIGNKACQYRQISLNERRFKNVVPTISRILYFVDETDEENSTIVYWGAKPGAKVAKQYIPVVSADKENSLLSDNIINQVITKVLAVMFNAKNGNVIDEANDSNKNAVIGQQVNPTLNKRQKDS